MEVYNFIGFGIHGAGDILDGVEVKSYSIDVRIRDDRA